MLRGKTSLPKSVAGGRALVRGYRGFSHRHWNRRYGCYLFWCAPDSCWYYYCAPPLRSVRQVVRVSVHRHPEAAGKK